MSSDKHGQTLSVGDRVQIEAVVTHVLEDVSSLPAAHCDVTVELVDPHALDGSVVRRLAVHGSQVKRVG